MVGFSVCLISAHFIITFKISCHTNSSAKILTFGFAHTLLEPTNCILSVWSSSVDRWKIIVKMISHPHWIWRVWRYKPIKHCSSKNSSGLKSGWWQVIRAKFTEHDSLTATYLCPLKINWNTLEPNTRLPAYTDELW